MGIRETTFRDGAVIERYLADMDGGAHFKVTRMTLDGKDIPVGSIDVVLPQDVDWDNACVMVPYDFIRQMRDKALAVRDAADEPGLDESDFYEHEGRYAALREVLAAIGHPNGGAA